MVEDKVALVMAQVFNIPVEEITEGVSSVNIKEWDSLSHMYFIFALVQSLGVSFVSEEIIEMLNYKLVVLTLKDKKVR